MSPMKLIPIVSGIQLLSKHLLSLPNIKISTYNVCKMAVCATVHRRRLTIHSTKQTRLSHRKDPERRV